MSYFNSLDLNVTHIILYILVVYAGIVAKPSDKEILFSFVKAALSFGGSFSFFVSGKIDLQGNLILLLIISVFSVTLYIIAEICFGKNCARKLKEKALDDSNNLTTPSL